MFKREGGDFSFGNSILMQRERGRKRSEYKKTQVRSVGKDGGKREKAIASYSRCRVRSYSSIFRWAGRRNATTDFAM